MAYNFNDILRDHNAMIFDFNAMTRGNDMNGLIIWYGMLRYGMLWDLDKKHRRLEKCSKHFELKLEKAKVYH